MSGDGAASIASIIEVAGIIAADAPVELKDVGITAREALLTICDDATAWRTPNGETFASLKVDGHIEHHVISGSAFRNWMIAELARRFLIKQRPASTNERVVQDVRMSLEARASLAGVRHGSALRVVGNGDSFYIDLGTPDWSAVKVTANGWELVPTSPIPILRSKRTGSFPIPVRGGTFAPLRRLLAHLGDDDYCMYVSFGVAALWPLGPYPIFVLGGEQGSGKTTLARLMQRLTDPVHGDLLQPPRDDRDLIAAARQNRLLGFDNLSAVRPDLADSLCRLSTGSEIGGRALYSDYDTATFSAHRPIIINGIPDLASRSDLASRAIVMRLGILEQRVTERDWQRQVEVAMPEVFGAFLDALVVALQRLDAVQTPRVRMADFARLIVAAEPALPWHLGAFLGAYERNRTEATATLVDGDLVAKLVRSFAGQQPSWTGLVSELYEVLSDGLPLEARRSRDWPGSARWFSDALRRAAPGLRDLGVNVLEHKRSAGGTSVTITTAAALAALAALAISGNDARAVRVPDDAANVASAAIRATRAPEQTIVKRWTGRA